MTLYLAEFNSNYHSKNIRTLYLDFEKAFNKVCHQKLLEKVRALGIGGNAMRLFQSYLFNRKQAGNGRSRRHIQGSIRLENHFFYNWLQQTLSKNWKLRTKLIRIFFIRIFLKSPVSRLVPKNVKGGTKISKIWWGSKKDFEKNEKFERCREKVESLMVLKIVEKWTKTK